MVSGAVCGAVGDSEGGGGFVEGFDLGGEVRDAEGVGFHTSREMVGWWWDWSCVVETSRGDGVEAYRDGKFMKRNDKEVLAGLVLVLFFNLASAFRSN